jgi:hypothetical protein
MVSEVSVIDFSHKDVVTALLKQQDIHEGVWSLAVKFGLTAANVQIAEQELTPAAIVSLANLRIERATEITVLSVDASVVNPVLPKKKSKKTSE